MCVCLRACVRVCVRMTIWMGWDGHGTPSSPWPSIRFFPGSHASGLTPHSHKECRIEPAAQAQWSAQSDLDGTKKRKQKKENQNKTKIHFLNCTREHMSSSKSPDMSRAFHCDSEVATPNKGNGKRLGPRCP